MNNNKYIAKQIILAQIASDGAKGRYWPSHYILQRYSSKGYNIKERCIFNAINGINRSKDSNFYYFVNKVDEYGGCFIVYFNTKIKGRRYQVSFHCFDNNFSKFANNNCSTRWDKENSRITTHVINNHYKVFKDYPNSP